MFASIALAILISSQTKPSAEKGPSFKAIPFNTPEADKIMAKLQIFPPDNPWNQEITKWPLHPNSKVLVEAVGASKPLRYNPDQNFTIVAPDQPRVNVQIRDYPFESDPGPFPVPDNLQIEGWPGGEKWGDITFDQFQRNHLNDNTDRHAVVVDARNGMLYEFFQMRKTNHGWSAAQASVFDLKSNALRPDGWTSTDAAGLPILPAIIRYDEIAKGEIRHALRVTIRKSRKAYVSPATHHASPHTDPSLPRMGERFRLKADYDISGFPPAVKTVLQALKTYGMIVADNGIEWAISCSPDPRIPNLHEGLRRVKGSDFEVVVAPGSAR